jgi:transcriptional regulator with XRE-family HTH domain
MDGIGKALKRARLVENLSQDVVCAAAGVCRSTLVHIESDKDVQLGKLNKVAGVLGLRIGVDDGSARKMATRLSRLEVAKRDADAHSKHLRIALRIVLDASEFDRLITNAASTVDLWESKKTCSATYIDRWRELLRGSPTEIAQKVTSAMSSEWGPALRQNTPFARDLS